MSLALRFVPVTVDDLDTGIAFYRDALGLAVANDVSSNGFRWVTLGGLGGPELVLSEPAAGRPGGDGDALRALLLKGVLPFLVLASDDVDTAFARAVAAGAEVLQEPADQPWGPRDCAFRDPAGNTVRVAQA